MKKSNLLKQLLLSGLILGGSMAAYAYVTKYDLKPPMKLPTHPRAPIGLAVSVEVNSSESELTFEFSPSIQALYVVLIDQSTGEIQTGMVDHSDPTMSAIVSDRTAYTLTCTTDAGYEFETTIEP